MHKEEEKEEVGLVSIPTFTFFDFGLREPARPKTLTPMPFKSHQRAINHARQRRRRPRRQPRYTI